ncbi:MAG: PHP domain-containing protein [Symbiobacteriaceae bacterium]|nr:MAG: PHP domain-containing protein [Bacillota bacterium]
MTPVPPRPETGADLHTHTTASDGTVTPEERVRMAREAGLAAVGVTDHDTLDGLPAARRAAAEAGLELVPGVELSAEVEVGGRRVDVHVLGYWVDEGDAPLMELLAERRRARERRLARILARLESGCGIVLDEARVRAIAGRGAVGRPHVARALVEQGVVSTVAEAFERFLAPGRPGYVPREPLPPARAFAAIREAGGVPVLAHPGLMPSAAWQLLPAWKDQGLLGIEVRHSQHTEAQVETFLRWAEDLGLVPTGGSDCHGPSPGQPALIGQVRIPLDWLDRLRELRRP